MHDLHEADKIAKLAINYGQQNKLKKITKITISLGSIVEHGQAILPENLVFNLENILKNTIAEGAEIKIKKSKSDFWRLKEIEGE